MKRYCPSFAVCGSNQQIYTGVPEQSLRGGQKRKKKIKLKWIKPLLPLERPSILLQFSRHLIFHSCGSQAHYYQNDSFLLFNYLRKIQREIKASTIADDVLYLQSHYIPGRSEGDSMEPLFVPLLTGMKVSSSDGEGSGKHLYLKSTLSTVAPSERG